MCLFFGLEDGNVPLNRTLIEKVSCVFNESLFI